MPIKNVKKRGRPRQGNSNHIEYVRTSISMPKPLFNELEEHRKTKRGTIPRATYYVELLQKQLDQIKADEQA